jgi:hypothetical protein
MLRELLFDDAVHFDDIFLTPHPFTVDQSMLMCIKHQLIVRHTILLHNREKKRKKSSQCVQVLCFFFHSFWHTKSNMCRTILCRLLFFRCLFKFMMMQIKNFIESFSSLCTPPSMAYQLLRQTILLLLLISDVMQKKVSDSKTHTHTQKI